MSDTDDDDDCAAYLAALEAVRRGGLSRYLKAHNVLRDNEKATRAAKTQYEATSFFHGLEQFALRTVASARSNLVDDSTFFPGMVWYGGVTNTGYAGDPKGTGKRIKGTVRQFVDLVLLTRAQVVAPKKEGWVVTPTTNIDGWRGNASTTAMHALNLDCDGSGKWDTLVAELDALGLAYIVYQSGGWKPDKPKWHLLVPLARPFDVSDENKRAAWKAVYHAARVLFGALGKLSGDGFDPSTDAPFAPIFVTEKRVPSDPPREVLWHPGHAFDIERLMSLPTPSPTKTREAKSGSSQAQELELDDKHLEEIVSALVGPMSNVPSGRRDLYLALPGVLLDRGIDPDDVLTICTELSARYPRPDDKIHADNVRAARTTIEKWGRDGIVTRIGTLQDMWPTVAHVLDDMVPDESLDDLREMFDDRRRALMGEVRAPVAAGEHADGHVVPVRATGITVSLDTLKKRLRDLRGKKRRAKKHDETVKAWMIDQLLKGESFLPYVEDTKQPVRMAGKDKPVDRNMAIKMMMGMLAYKLPVWTPFEAVKEMCRPSLAMMLEGDVLGKVFDRAEREFLESLKGRVEQQEERRVQAAADRERALAEHKNLDNPRHV